MNKESNFAKLYKMATNDKYVFEVNSIGRDVEIQWYHTEGYSGTNIGTLNIINMSQESYNSYGFKRDVGGIFIGSIIEQKYNFSLKYADNISEIYISNENWYSKAWNKTFAPYQITAHELYFHGYVMMINGRHHTHGDDYNSIKNEILRSGRK